MPFKEKSAWIMSLALLLGGVFYFVVVASMSSAGVLAPPVLPVLVIYTILLASIAIVGHIIIAVFAPRDASAKVDERERKIFDKSGHLSGIIFSAGIVLSLGLYLFNYNGNVLFYTVFGSLMISQLSEYLVQIFYYRTGVY